MKELVDAESFPALLLYHGFLFQQLCVLWRIFLLRQTHQRLGEKSNCKLIKPNICFDQSKCNLAQSKTDDQKSYYTPLTTNCILWSIPKAGTKQRYVPPSESWRLVSFRKTWPFLSSSGKTSALFLYAESCSFTETFPWMTSNTFLMSLCLQCTVRCFSSSSILPWLHFKMTESPSVLSTTWEARKQDFS